MEGPEASLTSDLLREIFPGDFEFRAEPAAAQGENCMGVVERVHVTHARTRTPHASVVVKTPPPPATAMAAVAEAAAMMAREVHFYGHVAPGMEIMDPQAQLWATYRGSRRARVLVLDDLTRAGYAMADRRSQLDLDHAVAVVTRLARFHAISVGVGVAIDVDLRAAGLHLSFSEENRDVMDRYIGASFRSLVRKMEEWPQAERYIDRVRHISKIVNDKVIDLLRPGSMNVLNHGDLWVNNVMFRYDRRPGGNTIESVKLIDFQNVRWSTPAYDLYYFLFSSVDIDVIERSLPRLLAEYHGVLREWLVDHGHVDRVFDFDDLRREMREKSFLGLVFSVLTLCVVLAESGDRDLARPVGDDVNPVACTRFSQRFKDAFLKHLRYFDKMGILR